MKKRICLLTALILILSLLGSMAVPAAGTLTVQANQSNVTVGQQVTVTAKYDGGGKGIGALDAYFHYNAKAFEYVSCNGASANGGAGSVKMSYYATEATAPQTVTITITLKAIAVGSGDFKWETEGMYDDDDNLLGTPSKSVTVAANNPTLSGDATLSYLQPSKGTLTPKFDKNITEYTVSVPYTVTRGLLNFTATDPGAKTEVTDNADLKVGKNTRVITVTAPNGATKKYTVVITREAEQTTTKGTTTKPTNSHKTTTTTAPILPAPEVEVEGKLMSVAVEQPPITPPAGFVWDYITLQDNEVSAAKQENGQMTLLYLTEKDAEEGALYIYDAAQDSFVLFRQITGSGITYVLRDLPASETAPMGTVPGTVTIGEQNVTAYVYEDPQLADYALLYLTTDDGVSALYTYDKIDGSLQRYHTVVVEKETIVEIDPEPQAEKNPVIAFVETYQHVILVGAAACAGLAVLIIVIVWVAGHATDKGKH